MNSFIPDIKTQKDTFIAMIRSNTPLLAVFIITLVILLIVSFFDIVTSQTVSSISISEYEVHQIADRTIIADQFLIGSNDDPVIISEGEEIIKKGFAITEEQYEKLLVMAQTPSYIDYSSFFKSFLYILLLSSLTLFLLSPTILGRKIKLKEAVFFAVTLIILYAVIVLVKKTVAFSNSYSLAIILPASFFVMLITIMFDIRLSVFASFLFSFAVLNASSYDVPVALFTLATCFFANAIIRKANKRIILTLIAITLGILNALGFFLIELIFNTNLEDTLINVFGVALNGFISGILILGFLTPLEYICNTASVFRLLELSDLNNPLMQRMLLNAPGTYNHSMLVATLAETACNDIGANGLLARVGSYYHDIGKIEQPEYFVENQREGNKHDEINPRLSVSVIRNHVKKGVERCNQLHLPTEVIDIVSQHHGNSTIYYFYNEAKKQDPNVSEDDFSYMGTKPTSKEAAVVMICDTVEAACRTLQDPSVSRLNSFIRKLILGKYETAQLDDANLTFDDLSRIQQALVNIMAGYYHSRIEYPNQNDDANDKKVESPKKTQSKKKKEAAHAE